MFWEALCCLDVILSLVSWNLYLDLRSDHKEPNNVTITLFLGY